MRFGAHVSVGKGYEAMAAYAVETGCECVQVFVKSPRQWKAPALSDKRVASMRRLLEAGKTPPVTTHTSYLINLSTDDDALRARSVAALADELVRAARLGCALVNTHVGTAGCHAPHAAAEADLAPLPAEAEQAARRAGAAAAEAVARADEELASLGSEAFAASPGLRPALLLEDTAGAGSTFGSSVGELAAAVEASGLGPERLGLCVDTCHAWAAGYDLSNAEGWDALLSRIDARVGLERLRLLHVNDCLHGRGEHKDRHAWVGRGLVGVEGFAAMVADSRLAGLDAVTEAPGKPPVKDEFNLAVLKAFRDGAGPHDALAAARERFGVDAPAALAGPAGD